MKRVFIFCSACFFVFIVNIFTSCNRTKDERLFTQLASSVTGISFSNDIHDNDSTYSFINEFGYMGGGVGIGDFNNDGLKDIFFVGNQVSSRLYINKGKHQFEDITEKAGIGTSAWCTGVSIVDINNDGFDDIYVSVFGKDLMRRAKNYLFINQRDLSFKEEAEKYGLADTGYSSQAAFFDYDRDGDLDMYLTNYLLSTKNTNTIYPRDRSGYSPANDRLYRNDGDVAQAGHPVFTDVSMQAGIKEDGYGLGVSISDFNNDGWPDIYVANDFVSNDLLWLNNRDGTFTNCITDAIQHQSYSSMGTDAADINNDALPDILTLDMMPEVNHRRKTSFSFMNYERYQAERAMGYEPEFMRNMLQLNNGNLPQGDSAMPFFSEIGQLSGVHATDWSWSVLLADFNNDGWKDIHVTNGIGRDFTDADFLEFSSNIFSSNRDRTEQERAIREKLASLQHVNLPNYFYLNNGDLTFSDYSEQAGINELSMSNGAAYADLDNDGDLDLVVNNINKKAFVFLNNTNQESKTASNHFLSLRLKGDSLNRNGFGAKVFVHTKNQIQFQEANPVRGYFSSVDQQLLFGLGDNDHADSLVIIWPDGRKQSVTNISADATLELLWENAGASTFSTDSRQALIFTDITSSAGLEYRHHDNPFNDYASQRLLPQKYSQLWPFIATGDINNDGATDFFIGGGFNFSGKLFTQQQGHVFSSKDLIDSIKFEEDMDCVLFDADNDGDADLLVTSGDMQYEENSIYYKPRLYRNEGQGRFSLASTAIPDDIRIIAGCVSAGDYDGDGDLDLFIGGRVSKEYPRTPRSFLLQNNNGVFTDVTQKVSPDLQDPGMVTSAVWSDFDKDGQIDLIIAGEWMPVRFFRNENGRLVDDTADTGLAHENGMWRSLEATDVDNDGDIDLVAGNLGLNCDFQVSAEEPMQLYATDLDGNGSIDPLIFFYIKGEDGKKRSLPAITRNRFSDQVPGIKKRFLHHGDYAKATFNDIFKGHDKDKILQLHCEETRSCYFENIGNGKFVKHPLPVEAQFAPVNAIVCDDLDNDGFKDLLLAGNEYQAEVISGRYDASYGCFLRGSNTKSFAPVSPVKSGFILNGDVKDMELITLPNQEKIILVAVNNDLMRVFKIARK